MIYACTIHRLSLRQRLWQRCKPSLRRSVIDVESFEDADRGKGIAETEEHNIKLVYVMHERGIVTAGGVDFLKPRHR
jgi:hypothetical protein